MRWLTRPTRWRIALWLTLTIFWSLSLIPALFPPVRHPKYNVVGGLIWIAVWAWLLSSTWLTWRGRRRQLNAPEQRQR